MRSVDAEPPLLLQPHAYGTAPLVLQSTWASVLSRHMGELRRSVPDRIEQLPAISVLSSPHCKSAAQHKTSSVTVSLVPDMPHAASCRLHLNQKGARLLLWTAT